VSPVVGVWIKFLYATKRPGGLPVSEQYQANVTLFSASSAALRTAEKRVFVFALGGQGSRLINVSSTNPGWHITAHHRADHRETVASAAEIRLARKIIGTGKRRIERDTGSRGAPAKLRAQDIEHQRLGRGEPLCQRWRRPP